MGVFLKLWSILPPTSPHGQVYFLFSSTLIFFLLIYQKVLVCFFLIFHCNFKPRHPQIDICINLLLTL